MKLSVEFQKRDFTTPLTFPDVEVKPERYSWHRGGGPELATVQAYGSSVALWQMLNWLRAPVTIRDERGKKVWWGYIAEVTVGVGSVQLGLTLQGMANRVKVFYPDQADGSPSQELETDWAEDADSIGTYGTFELVARLTGTSATLEMANAWRDQLLGLYKYPRPVIRSSGQGGSELKATVRCRGWWFSLAWEHYANMATEDAETTSQIATIAGQGQFILGTDVPDQSGVYTSQFRDGTEPMLAIVELMLASGVDGGNQLAATVTADRLVRVFEEPSADELYLLPNGTVADVYGDPVLNHECPVAKWCALRDVIPPTVIVSRLADVGRFFVERSEYTVADGKWVPFPKGQPSAGSALVSAAAGKGGGAGFVGRFEGPHAGLFRFPNDDGTWSVLMQVADTANVPFLSAGARNFKSNSRWLRIGYEDKAHIYLAAPTDGSDDPEEHTDLVIPALALDSGAATDGQILVADGASGVDWEDPAAGGVVDATDVTYTPAVAADWDGDADPGDADEALDQLAERVDDLEGAAPADIGAKVSHSEAESIATATWTALSANTEEYDTDAMHDTVTNNSRLTCKTAGKYWTWGEVVFAADGTGDRAAAFDVNGADANYGTQRVGAFATGNCNLTPGVELQLEVDDYVECRARHSIGSNLDVQLKAFGMRLVA